MNYDHGDLLKAEMFEHLFPGLFYHGTKKDQLITIDEMTKTGKQLLEYLFRKMCDEDGKTYPYPDDYFDVETFERGGMSFIQIHAPLRNPSVSEIYRVYIVYTRNRSTQELVYWRYFFVKKFWDTQLSFPFYIDPEMNILIGDEVPDNQNDFDHEIWQISHTYLHVIASEFADENKEI